MRKLYFFAFFLVLYEFTAYSANDMIMPGMIAVVNQFNAPLSYVALSLSLYMLGECVVQLGLGPLSERFGNRKIILYGNFSFLIFTLLIATSMSIGQFMVGRWLQGSGMAFIAMGYALIHEKFNDRDAVRTIAIMGNISILAPLVGPLIGGIIITFSNWHYIFVVTGILGAISLVGLFYFAPESTPKIQKMQLVPILKHYREILVSPNFILGIFCTIAGAMPLLIWIGLAPNLILHHLKLGYSSYIIYQIISLGGLVISSIAMQFLAGRWKLHQLIRRGVYIAFTGTLISFCLHFSIALLSIGLFFYSLGLGLANGSIIRIIMSNKAVSQSMAASVMTFTQTLVFALGIEFSDWFCAKFDYSALSFTASCLVAGTIALFINLKFANRYTNRAWE